MMWYAKLGGRKFIGVVLASIVMFISLIWTFIVDNPGYWTYLTGLTTTYFLFLATYAGLQIWQKKIVIQDDNNDNKNKNLLTD